MVLVPLAPCVTAKPLGDAERVKFGTGFAVETLSKVAVARLEVLPLLAPRPTYTLCAMLIVWLVPICVQFTPSGEP
jgi:hypothetical protein